MTNKIMWKIQGSWRLYALLFLPVVYFIVFKYIPMFGAVIAFKNYNLVDGILGSKWVGFDHFIRFFESYDFWRIMRNTIVISLYQLVVGIPFPILLAIGLNYLRSKFFRKTAQMITYAPHFISVVVMVGIILQFLSPRTGIVNNVIQLFGFEPMNFIGEPGLFQSIFVWSGAWQNLGFSCIIYLAALSGIDPSLHEAAVVDGASLVRRVWNIDLPGILPIAIILLILNTGSIMDLGFEKVYLMQNQLNLQTSEVIETYVYKIALASPIADFSYSTAIGLFKSIINLVLLIAVNQIARKTKQTSLW